MDQGKKMSDEDELAKRRAEEYEMQLFGFNSRSACDEICRKIKENIDYRCRKIHESIEKKYNPDDEKKELLKSNISQLRKTYQRNMQPHLTTIENIVSKFICVPNNVLLEVDKSQAIQYSDEEFHDLESKLERLQQEAKRVTIFNSVLKEELATSEQTWELEKMARKLCDIIDKALSAKKPSNKTLRAVDKVKGLKETLDSLQPQTQKDIYNPSLNENNLEQIFFL